MQEVIIKNQQEMIEFAQNMAKYCKNNAIYGLKGTLGAGKSFFAKNFINFLQDKNDEIISPTFNIVLPYNSRKGEIFHFDLYRIKNKSELENIEFFDNLKSGICLIEWPEIAENYLLNLKNYTQVTIKIMPEEERLIIVD